ncbi:MAG TPA: YidC/Oxa1 family membrane protein insertase, partial [Acidimicrobiales bacterium]
MNGFFELISGLLNFFYELVPNYAVAIALLTCVVMLATTPLTLKGTRSMIEMQRLQPQIRKLQAQYKDDRQKLNEELMKFYKEHEINPLGGCFPLLIQAPVFSILFYVVRGLTNPYKFTGVQKALADHGIDPVVSEGFRPKYLDHGDELYQALVGQTHMNAFGIDLARSAATALSEGFLTALPYIGLVAVIAGLSWFQQRQIMGRNAGTEITSQQRMMMRLGPAMYVFFAFVSPAAIGVYFLVSTFWRVVQQYYITRSLYRGEDSVGVQAQRAMAEMREARKQDGGKDGSGGRGGGGGLLDRLTGGAQAKATGSGSGSGKASGSGKGSGSGKAAGSGRDGGRSAAKTTENGSAATRGKAGASNGSRPRSGGGGGGAGAGAGAPSGP